MGRLTERSNIGWWLSELKDESSEYDDCSICCEKQQGCDCCRNCPIQKAVDKLAHYEDMEEQDRMIEVVRCKDCSQYDTGAGYDGWGLCELYDQDRKDNDYCSFGELKELENE